MPGTPARSRTTLWTVLVTLALLSAACRQEPTIPRNAAAAAAAYPDVAAISGADIIAAQRTIARRRAAARADHQPPPDDFDAMKVLLHLHGQQLADFDSLVRARAVALTDWLQSDAGRELTAARRNLAADRRDNDAAQRAADQAACARLAADQARLHRQWQARVLAVLLRTQQETWAGYLLLAALRPNLADANLTDNQLAHAADICRNLARRWLNRRGFALNSDPYLQGLNELRAQALRLIHADLPTAHHRATTPATPKPAATGTSAAPPHPTTRPGTAALSPAHRPVD